MLETLFENYEEMTDAESLRRYDWGYSLKAGSTVLRWESEDNAVMVGINLDGDWWCEVEGFEDAENREGWNMLGQGWSSESPEAALLFAVADVHGASTIREEGNCEDAVNVIAYKAYQLVYGKTPLMEMEPAKMDPVMDAAYAYVRHYGPRMGVEWEEFREAV